MDLSLDIEGKLRRLDLPFERSLMPLFEAVMNSIDAINARADSRPMTGYVHVALERAQGELGVPDAPPALVTKCIVTDNGVGFTSDNYEFFLKAETTHKLEIGGKGVGRFLWLKAYASVEITSRYSTGVDSWAERQFSFDARSGVVGGNTEQPTSKPGPLTIVRLCQQRKEYADTFPRDVHEVAVSMVEHFMLLFLNGRAPRITVTDGKKTVELADLFESEYRPAASVDRVNIEGEEFALHHIRLYSRPIAEHRLWYCAHSRHVKHDDLKKRLGLPPHFNDEHARPFVWLSFVEGAYLNENVDHTRGRFNIDREDDDDQQLSLRKKLTWEEIRREALSVVRKQLRDFLAPLNEAKKARIVRYIRDDAQRFLALIPFLDRHLETIKVDISDRELDEALGRIYYTEESKIRAVGRRLRGVAKNGDDINKRLAKYGEYLENVNHFGKAALAQYVVYRKAVLEFLDECLSITSEGKYHAEERVHDLIMPRKTTSEDAAFQAQNLWLVDERLVFHEYLVSDKEFTWKKSGAKRPSKRLPDIFVKMAAFSDELPDRAASSVVLVEFKKPCRTEYPDDENPIEQVKEYARLIRSGEVKDPNGRLIDWAADIPMYAYVLCDITDKIKRYAESAQLHETPDKMGYFGYMPSKLYKLYVEVISYRKMRLDAARRNKVFFEKAGLL